MDELDPRLLQIDINIGGRVYSFSGAGNVNFAIHATGILFANPYLDVAEITLYNLDRATQDYLMNVTSPYRGQNISKIVSVYAGRQSYGNTLIYRGAVIISSITQPADIGITLSCISGLNYNTNIYSVSASQPQALEQLFAQWANLQNVAYSYQASKNPTIPNFSYSGTAAGHLAYINSFQTTTSFVTQGNQSVLNITDQGIALRGTLRIVSEDTGMIGVPEWTELGIRVTFFIDNKTHLGGRLRIISKRYPTFNGDYVIFKLGFNLASRDTPFYYIAEAAHIAQAGIGLPG